MPILFIVFDTLRDVRERKTEIEDRIPVYWAVGSAVLHFLGAGVWGFAHTLPQINKWTHGTQITASHGHFAFFGAYVMINLTMMYFAVPKITGVSLKGHGRSLVALRFMVFSMVFMVLALAIAGIVQSYLKRVLGMDYLTTQDYMKLWYAVMWVSGWGVATGVFIYILDFFRMGRPARIAAMK